MDLPWLSALTALDVRLFTLGGVDIRLSTLLSAAVMIVFVVTAARWLDRWTARRLLARTDLDVGTRQAIAAMVRYVTLLVGFVATAQTVGLNLTTFNVLAGAVGVGVGFGLQNIVSNFVSGLIIMLERPIKVGDRIEMATFDGEVKEIGARRTTIVTNDNVAILVPNQKFITDNVVNLRYWDSIVRVRLPVTVAAGTDAATVREALLEIARANPAVLDEPPPAVRLLAVAGNMTFELQVWNRDDVHRRDQLVSALNYAIVDALRARDIRAA